MSGISLLVVDDNPHVRWAGAVHPVNATFHRFLASVLDLPGGPVARLSHVVPTREAAAPPQALPLDPRIRSVASAPFDGIAGFLRHGASISRANRPILAAEIDAADLVWLRVPASNAALAAALARRSGTPRFGWVAGSAARVAAGRQGNPLVRLAAVGVGIAYDAVGRLAGGSRRIVVGRGVVHGDGIVASLLDTGEVRNPAGEAWTPARPVRLAWAGRVVDGKGLARLPELLVALPDVRLTMLGEGPARPAVEAHARRLGVDDRLEWRGYVADRVAYLAALAGADVLVHPSPAEGFPKVVLDAMAVGLPVVAVPSGGLAELARARLIAVMGARRAEPVGAVRRLLDDPAGTQAMRERATAFAAAHTATAEAARLVERLRAWFPALPWT